MKIYLGIDIQPIQGYTNLDPCGGHGKIPVEPSNLDTVCQQAECTELLADNILDYIHGSKLLATLQNWTGKLRHGGKLIIGGTDLTTLSRSLYHGKIPVSEGNKILFGWGDNPWATKMGCYSCFDIASILEEMGYTVVRKRLSGIKFIVEAQRV
jgi:hypothetical protein